MSRRYLQLDVFADRPGAGNPLAVVLDSAGLDDASMLALAAWLNLSETVFFQPAPGGADYSVRIFTPKGELPFAGHPSVGAGWAALAHGLASPGDAARLVQHCGAGLLPVRIDGEAAARRVHVRSPRAEPRSADFPVDTLPGLAPLLDPALPPQLWNNGPDWWIAAVRSEDALRGYSPELAAIAALPGKGKLALFAPARSEAGDSYAVRAFAPGVGIAEDPVTGSANALVAACLLRAGAIAPGTRYIASQGRELGRDGKVEVQVDADRQVWIGGRVQPVIQGHIDWPPAISVPLVHRSPT